MGGRSPDGHGLKDQAEAAEVWLMGLWAFVHLSSISLLGVLGGLPDAPRELTYHPVARALCLCLCGASAFGTCQF